MIKHSTNGLLFFDGGRELRIVAYDVKRTKLMPVNPGDLETLIEMGLVEMRDDSPLLTNAAHQALDQ